MMKDKRHRKQIKSQPETKKSRKFFGPFVFCSLFFLFAMLFVVQATAKDDLLEIEEDSFRIGPSTKEAIALREKIEDIKGGVELKSLSRSTSFESGETPVLDFEFSKKTKGLQKFTSFLKSIVSDEYKTVKVQTSLVKGNTVEDFEPSLEYQGGGEYKLDFEEVKDKLRPGKYKIEIEISDSEITDGEVLRYTQDFTWGVLAFNSNKSLYKRGEEAYLQFAVLDDNGNTLCDADIEIEINTPGFGTDKLSTFDNTIIKNPECGPNNVIDTPDYYAHYPVKESGEYEVAITAYTKNGVRQAVDFFRSERNPEITVERIAPTRIWPKADYDMEIIIEANEDFEGDIVETVPKGFRIYDLRMKKNNGEAMIHDSLFTIQNQDNKREISFNDLKLEKGDNLKITYKFDAPNISPEFYLLGELQLEVNPNSQINQLTNYSEERAWQIASDAVGTGIAWMAATSTTYGTDINPATSYALEWWEQDFDTTKYSFDDNYPTRLNVEEDGDYLVAITIPMYRSDGANNRTRIEAEFRVNGTKQDVGVTRPSYIRNSGGHDESSNNMVVLLEDLSADEYIEIFVKGITDNRSPVYITDQASMFVEKIEDTETVYTGTATQTTDSTDLSGASAFELEWTSSRIDTGYTNSTAQDIVITAAGDYYVSVNIPMYTITARANLTGQILLDGTPISGGTFQQGYVRNSDSDTYASIHWNGVVQTTGSNQVLSVSTIENGSSGTVTVGADKASIYVQRLPSTGIYYGRGTNLDVGTDWNDSTPRNILWENDDIIDTGVYTHSTASNQHQITVSQPGDYLVSYNDAMQSSAGRPSNMIELLVNGTAIPGAQTNSHYIRSSNQQSSANLTFLLTDLVANDIITVTTKQSADTDTVNDMDDAILFIRYIDDRIPPETTINSVTQKTDGTGAIDFSIEAVDGNDDEVVAKVEYVYNSTCDFTTPLDVTIDSTDANVSADYGDPDVDNNHEFQVGTTSARILTDSGSNTVNFDWLSKNEIDDATSTYCVRVTLQDEGGTEETEGATSTVYVDNLDPQLVSAAIPAGAYIIGDIITATITVQSDLDSYTLSTSNINGGTVSNLQKIDSSTYTVDYTIEDGQADRTVGTIPYSFILSDSYGNSNAAFTGVFSNGSIDANSPSIQSITTANLMYAVGDILTVTITVSSDVDVFTLQTSSLNKATSSTSNLQKINNTTYTLDYLVAEGDDDSGTGTIQTYVSLQDASGNISPYYWTELANGSVDANSPSVQTVYIANGDYGIGDAISVSIDATEAGLHESVILINSQGITGFTDQGDSTYLVTYTVSEGDTDQTAGNIPISIILQDDHGNTSSEFTTPAGNSASVDANKPQILTIELPNIDYIIGDTIRATTTVTADTNTYIIGTTTINNVDATNLQKIDDSTYTFDYTVQSGDTNRIAGAIPVSLMLKDQLGQYNNPASTTVLTNTASIDANAPVISNVSFEPSSGMLIVGQVATATISLLDGETLATVGTVMTINSKDVRASFHEIGGGDYELVYTIEEGDTYHADNDDLPVNFNVYDASGNLSDSYTTANPASRPGVDGGTPTISSIVFEPSSGTLKVGATATATITVGGAETGLASGTVMTINGVDVRDTFIDNNDGTYTVAYTVQEGDNDIDDTSEDLPIDINIQDQAGNISTSETSTDIAGRPGVDAHTPAITGVTFLPTSGTLIVGETATATIAVSNSEQGLASGTVMTINGQDVRDTFIDITDGLYTVTYTVQEGDTDVDDDSEDLVVNLTIQDSAGNVSSAYVTSNIAARPGVDANTPSITDVSFEPLSGILTVGETATATITVGGAETGLASGTIMTINTKDVRDTFYDNNDGTYSVTYIVQEGDNDIYDIADLPVYFLIKDQAGNESAIYNTSDPANRPGVDAHTPSITNVTFSPTNGTLKVGDITTATITVSNLETGLASGTIMTINGVDVRDSMVDWNDGTYTVTYTVQEGNNDVDDTTEDLPVNLAVRDVAGNQSPAYITSDIATRPGVDANTTSITNVIFEPSSGLLKVGDIATATITAFASESGLLASTTMTINGVDVSSTFNDLGTGQYTVTYTVQEGDTDRLNSEDLPVNFVLIDEADNESPAYTSADIAGRPGVDANTPSAPGNLTFFSHTNNEITLSFGSASTEDNFYEYKIFYKVVLSGVTELDSEWNSSDDSSLGDKNYLTNNTTTITGLATGTDYVFNIIAYDTASNSAWAVTEVQASTNKAPAPPIDLVQKENDNVTTVANDDWAIDQTVLLSSTSTDPELQFVDFYYEVLPVASSFTAATTVPSNTCHSGDDFNDCTSKIWKYSTGPAWYDTDWLYRKQISIDADLVVANETDFPLLSSSIDEDLKREARSDGYDIIFTESDGVTPLNFERKLWDSSTGQLISWIKTDLSSSTDNFIYMYYGNASHSTDLSTTTGVWDSSYLGVWHMDEVPTGSSDDIKDSSGNDRHMTSYNMDSSKRIVTDTGYAYEFDGAGDYLEDADGENYINGLSAFTVELWLKSDVTGSDRGFIIGETPAGNDSFFTLRYDASGANNGGAYSNLVKGAITSDLSGEIQFESSEGVQTTAWQHLVFRWQSGGQYEVFIDGAEDTPTYNDSGATGVTTGADRLRIGQGGKDTTASLGWDGYIDEVRISNVYRTDAFVKTAYNNQSNLNSFALFGAQEAVRIYNLPESSSGYKWQVMACDALNNCSDWVLFNATTPNFKVDNTAPTAPGNLTENTHDSTSVTLNFGSVTTESFFDEYRIYYKEYDGTPVSTADAYWGSADDGNLGNINFNSESTTTVPYLTAGVQYEFNIFSVDQSGQMASATPITVTTATASNPPTGLFNSAAQKIDGSGAIDISIEVNDADNDPAVALIEYESGSSCTFGSPLDPTLDTDNVSADNLPVPDIDNDQVYQIGSSTAYILTSPTSNTVNFDWLSKTDIPSADGVYCLRLTANDGTFDQSTPDTTTIYIDNDAPSTPGNLFVKATGTTDVILEFGSISTDSNFDYYKIFYTEGSGGVTESDNEHIDDDLLDQNFNTTSSTTISSLSSGTQYTVNIWAYDDYGNVASATEQTFWTNAAPENPSAVSQFRSDGTTVISNGGWTNENKFRLQASVIDQDNGDQITVYFEIASTTDSFTSSIVSPCAFDATWETCTSRVWSVTSAAGDYTATPYLAYVAPQSVPDEYTGYKWQVMACDDRGQCSSWVDAGTDPNIKLDNTAPSTPGNLTIEEYSENTVTLGFNGQSNEDNFLEYIIYYKEGTSGVLETDTEYSSSSDVNLWYQDYQSATSTQISSLTLDTDYVFNIWVYDQAGNKAYATEVTQKTNVKPTISLDAVDFRTDGTGVVDLDVTANDIDTDDLSVKVEYEAGLTCTFASPLDPTLDETDANATSTLGDAKIENDNSFQIGNASGWIDISGGANTVHFDWLSQADIPDIEGNYCIRVTASDSHDVSVSDTITVYIDNLAPSTPGDLTLDSLSGDEIVLQFGDASTEINWDRYYIYYKEGVTAVSESDTPHNDPDLLDINFNSTTNTTISGLDANTQYSFRIFAHDTYGNISQSGQTSYTTNAQPTGLINSAAQKTDASGRVDISIEVYDINGDDCYAKMEYVSGATCDFASPLDPSLDEDLAYVSADYGLPGIENDNEYQIGTSSGKIITSSGSNTINFDWLTQSDIPAANGIYCLRLTVFDETDTQTSLATTTLYVDNLAPTAPGNLVVDYAGGTNVRLNFGAAGSDSNFSEYKIFYKKDTSGVTESDQVWTQNDDSVLAQENLGGGGASTTITSLFQDSDYYFNIWIYDTYGNSAFASEVATKTLLLPTASWREVEDSPDPTLGDYAAKEQTIRLRISVANTGDWDAEDYLYQLEYGEKAGNCQSASAWTQVPVDHTTEHFEMVDSLFFDPNASTTARLANTEAYTFVPGYLMKDPNNQTGNMTLSADEYTELEYTIAATTNASRHITYCFRVTNQGTEIDNYDIYPEFSLTPPPVSSFVDVNEHKDGSGLVEISFEANDFSDQALRAKLEYEAGTDCLFVSPQDPTLSTDDQDTTATYDDPSIDNNHPYQIGTTSAMITTQYGTNTVELHWQSQTDIPDVEGDYCLRLTANDTFDDQTEPATTTVMIDNKNPSAPGDLVVESKTLSSVTLAFGATSSDTNFLEYIIYYKEGESGVTESDTAYSSTSDANLYAFDFNGFGSTTISDLNEGSQYVFKIWAYDAFGNKAYSSGEVTTKLVPTIGGVIYSDQGSTPDLSGHNVSIAVDGVLEDTVVSSGVDGSFLFSDIDPPATGTPIVVFIDNEAIQGAAYSLYGGEGAVSDFHIYSNTVIMKHYQEGPLAASHVDYYDKDQDADIPIQISGINMTLDSGVKIYVWPGSTFENGSGNLNLYDVEIDGSMTAVGEQVITVDGSWDGRSGSFLAASSTVEFTSTQAGNTIYTNDSPFYNINFNGVGGEWTIYSNASSTAWATTSAGTLIQGANIDLEFESFTILSGASFTKASGTGRFIFEGPDDGYFEDQNVVKNNLGNVRVGYSPATTRLNSDFVADSLIVGIGDSFYLRGYEADITNYVHVYGNLDAIDDKEGDGTIITLGTDWTVEPSGSFVAGNSTTTFDGSSDSLINTGGNDASHDFNILTIEKSSVATATLDFYDILISDNLIIAQNSGFDASSTNQEITVGGDWINDGTFEARAGTTTFSSIVGGNIIEAGNSDFYNLEFNNLNGGWTIVENATTTNNLFVSAIGSLTVNSGVFLEVQGTFLNQEGGADTTWTGSTLYLNSSQDNLINSKVGGQDVYGNLLIGSNADVSMWNSSASSYSVEYGGSLYSMDHSDLAGQLYIWGDYFRASGNEHWSYATDFDGADLSGGSERQAIVRLADSATTTFAAATLQIVGSASASTTIDVQSSGAYRVEMTGGTLDARYFDFKNLDSRGLYLNGTVDISNLNNGSFELAVDSGSCLTVNASTLNLNATTTYADLYFATSTNIGGYNVSLNGTPNTYWTFLPSYGNLSGEDFDFDMGDPRGYLIWEDSPDYEPRSQVWRFYHDEDVLTPIAPAASEEVSPATISPNSKLKLRMTINEFDGIAGNNVKMRLQYSEYSDFSQDVYDVGEIGSTTPAWRFFDGAGVDNALIAARVLSDSTVNATHNESGLSESSYAHAASTATEWEFVIHAHNAATDTVYYFRPIVKYDTLFPDFEKPVTIESGYSYPSLTLTEAALSYSISGVTNNQSVEGILTDVTTTASQVGFGALNIDTEVEAAQRFTITTNADGGYQLFVMQKNNLIAQNGADIDPISATNDAPAAWPATPDPSGFGYHTGDDTLSSGFSSRFAADNTYCQFGSSMEEVSYSPIPVEAETVDFVYKLEVSSMQEAGDYQTEITYILVPTF